MYVAPVYPNINPLPAGDGSDKTRHSDLKSLHRLAKRRAELWAPCWLYCSSKRSWRALVLGTHYIKRSPRSLRQEKGENWCCALVVSFRFSVALSPQKPSGLLGTGSPKLQALVYDILPSTTTVFSYAIGFRKLSANELVFFVVVVFVFFCFFKFKFRFKILYCPLQS